MTRWRWLFVAALFAPISPAAGATFETDIFSFFHVPGANLTRQLDTSAIPVQVTSIAENRWSLRIQASRVELAPFVASSEEILLMDLASDAVGELALANDIVTAQLNLTVRIRKRGVEGAAFLPLSFTSEQAATSNPELQREGVPYDPSSGYFQLVAVAVSPTLAGHPPFYVVLSGRLLQVPAALTADLTE